MRQTSTLSTWVILAMVSGLTAALGARPASAHEYWIEALPYKVASGGTFDLFLKNGQEFAGTSFPFIESRFERFERQSGDTHVPVEGVPGSLPAIDDRTLPDGLHTYLYISEPQDLIYRDYERFLGFLDYEGLRDIEAEHIARGLPETGFKERYRRYAKALIQVGTPDAAQKDQPFGAAFEWVAVTHPYASNGPVTLQLLRDGAPLADWPINVFRKPSDENADKTRVHTRTDENGLYIFDDPAFSGTVMLNAVVILPLENQPDDAVWLSEWASVTFAAGS